MQRQHQRAIGALVRFISHLRHDRVNRPAKKLQHVEGMALGLKQVVERMAGAALSTETPGGKGQISKLALLNGMVRQVTGLA